MGQCVSYCDWPAAETLSQQPLVRGDPQLATTSASAVETLSQQPLIRGDPQPATTSASAVESSRDLPADEDLQVKEFTEFVARIVQEASKFPCAQSISPDFPCSLIPFISPEQRPYLRMQIQCMMQNMKRDLTSKDDWLEFKRLMNHDILNFCGGVPVCYAATGKEVGIQMSIEEIINQNMSKEQLERMVADSMSRARMQPQIRVQICAEDDWQTSILSEQRIPIVLVS